MLNVQTNTHSNLNPYAQELLEHSKNIIRGKQDQILLNFCAFLAGGHVLIEDTPGVGKTTMVKYLAKALGFKLSRIQFTNDLLPADIVGTHVYSKKTEEFKFIPGPIFGEIILADELNRASPKTQSALLQSMEERVISVDGEDLELSKNFFVVATQNPHGQIGTYPLPESQIDRFMMKLSLGYLDKESSMDLFQGENPGKAIEGMEPLWERKVVEDMLSLAKKPHCSEKLVEYVYKLLEVSRSDSKFMALSTRCGIDLVSLSRSYAYIQGRDFVLPEDIKLLFPYVAGHRLVNSQQAGVLRERNLAHEILEQITP